MKKYFLPTLTGLFLLLTTTACSSSETEEKTVENTVNSYELSQEEVEKYAEIGLNFALTTKQTLGQNLMNAIKEGGAVHAVDFCNTVAIPLTDSMGVVYNAKIKRVTDKPRNPNNAAGIIELEQIDFFKEQLKILEKSNEIKPNVAAENDKIHFYYPILTNDLCLQCHGIKNEKILPETLNAIAERYPNDKATGYETEQIRGIWSITFPR